MTHPFQHWSLPNPVTGDTYTMTTPNLPSPKSTLGAHTTIADIIPVYYMEDTHAIAEPHDICHYDHLTLIPCIIKGDRVYLTVLYDFFV